MTYKPSDIYGGDFLKSLLPQRKTDEPRPEKPQWLYDREWLERSYERVANALSGTDDDYNQGYESDLEDLEPYGITAEVVIHGTLPDLTEDQQRKKGEYEAACAAWEERNPIISHGPVRRYSPLLMMLDPAHTGELPNKITWGFSSPKSNED